MKKGILKKPGLVGHDVLFAPVGTSPQSMYMQTQHSNDHVGITPDKGDSF